MRGGHGGTIKGSVIMPSHEEILDIEPYIINVNAVIGNARVGIEAEPHFDGGGDIPQW